MILKKNQKADIARRIDFMQIQISDLSKFAALTWETYQEDRDTQRNVERLAENIANAAIDISKVMIAGEETNMPNSYREIILKLGEIGILEEGLSDEIANYAALRNVLAHDYLDIRWSKIKNFISKAPKSIPKFIEAIKKKI